MSRQILHPLENGIFCQSNPSKSVLHVDEENLVVRAVISTAIIDRAGDIVVPRGLQNRDEFLQNPVVLWAHQRTIPPIGMCQCLELLEDRIIAETKFARGVAFAEEVFQLYAQGILRGWSIGFIPRQAFLLPRRNKMAPPGMRVEQWDLVEYSAVPIPENPAALTMAIRKGMIKDHDLREWLTQDVMMKLVA